MKAALRRIPVEGILWFLLAVIFFLLSIFHTNALASREIFAIGNLVFLFFFGDAVFLLATAFTYLYLVGKILCFLSRRFFHQSAPPLTPLLSSLAFLAGNIALFTAAISILIAAIHPSPSTIIAANTLLAGWDTTLFSTSPLIALQTFAYYPLIDELLVAIYANLVFVFSIVALLLVIREELFRKFFFSFLVASLFALPLWYAYPAISPNELYRAQILPSASVAFSPEEQSIVQLPITENLRSFLRSLEGYWSIPEKNQYAITSFPSMHVTWGFLAAYYATALWWPIGIIMVPYAFVNALSTVYTLQHYAVDSISGIAIAFIAVLFTHYCFAFERRYYTGTHWQFAALSIIKNDLRNVFIVFRDAVLFRKP